MTHERYSLILAAAVLLPCAGLAGLSLSQKPLVGDLARVGRYSENSYAPRAPQEGFIRRRFDSKAREYDRPYDIVVLGDSFSHEGSAVWQNFLEARTGATIAAFHHGSTPDYHAILDSPRYKEAPPRVFVYELVERSLKHELGSSGTGCDCGPTPSPRPLQAKADPADLRPEPRDERKGLFDANIGYAWSYVRINLYRMLIGHTSDVYEFPLKRALFSSRRGDSLLVFQEDLNKRDWTEDDLVSIRCSLRRMQKNVQAGGKTLFLALVVPDKLSVYADEIQDGRGLPRGVIEALSGGGLKLIRADLALKRAAAAGTLDVYLPDETHTGAAGSRLIADVVEERLRASGALKGP
jgi:hypothetical protein